MSVEELKQELAASRARLLRAIAGVSEEQFKRRPPAGPEGAQEWCIAEVLAHLLASERLACERISLALREDGAAVTPSPPEAHETAARSGRLAPVPQLIHGLLAARRELERLLEAAGGLEDGLERSVTHPVRGRQTVAWMAREKVMAHEEEHVGQIEALRAAVGAPPVGEG